MGTTFILLLFGRKIPNIGENYLLDQTVALLILTYQQENNYSWSKSLSTTLNLLNCV